MTSRSLIGLLSASLVLSLGCPDPPSSTVQASRWVGGDADCHDIAFSDYGSTDQVHEKVTELPIFHAQGFAFEPCADRVEEPYAHACDYIEREEEGLTVKERVWTRNGRDPSFNWAENCFGSGGTWINHESDPRW